MDNNREAAKLPAQIETITLYGQGREFIITPHSDSNLSIKVYDKIAQQRYEANSVQLRNIHLKTLLIAFQGTNKDVKVETRNATCEHIELLVLKVTVNNVLLANISEEITCRLTKKLEDSEILLESLKSVKSKIAQLHEYSVKSSESQTRFVVQEQNEKSVNSGLQTCDVASLVLPQGKYLLTFSFFVRLPNQWLYAGLKQTNYSTRGIPFDAHQGFYGQMQGWIPTVARQSFTVRQDDSRLTFQLFSGSSYPSSIRNFVMTAEKLDD